MVRQTLGSRLTMGGSFIILRVISKNPGNSWEERRKEPTSKDEGRWSSEGVSASRNIQSAVRPGEMEMLPGTKGGF
jgi:hypothetical protein